jgi:sucrose-6-phosphate hydrolase SacC (GH32 family)
MKKTHVLTILFALGLSILQIPASCETSKSAQSISLDVRSLSNPVWSSHDLLRDPSVLKTEDGYLVFYSRLAPKGRGWADPASWAIGCAFTRDFKMFSDDHDVTGKGFASPGDVVFWHGRYILPYQSYPATPTQMHFSESKDLKNWSEPKVFLPEARNLPWNTYRRVIDPTLVVDGDTLHCYFVGSADNTDSNGKKIRANLMGHAVTKDPALETWEILTAEQPLIGVSEQAPDGVENTMVFRTGDVWTMIYSEGLADQHLARATSKDLRTWHFEGPIEMPRQEWMARKYGAPFVWKEPDQWLMILMGENQKGRTTFGLVTSPDGTRWTLLPENKRASEVAGQSL